MTIKDFQDLISSKIVILDGATGSNLMKAGMPVDACTEEWAIEHPEVVVRIQKEYIEAGAQILYAPTFGANRIKLAEYGLENQIEVLDNTAYFPKKSESQSSSQNNLLPVF